MTGRIRLAKESGKWKRYIKLSSCPDILSYRSALMMIYGARSAARERERDEKNERKRKRGRYI